MLCSLFWVGFSPFLFLLLRTAESNCVDCVEDNETHRVHEYSSFHEGQWPDVVLNDEPLRIAIMHVGKAGGAGLRATLGMHRDVLEYRNQCWLTGRNLALNDGSYNQSSIALLSLEDAWARAGCNDIMISPQKTNTTGFFSWFSHWWASDPVLERSLLPISKHIFYECHATRWCDDDHFLRDANTFFFSTRHPISRIVSAFNFGRYMAYQKQYDKQPKEWPDRIYGECFENIDHVAQTLLDQGLTPKAELPEPNTHPDKISCAILAQNFVLGLFPVDRGVQHFYCGYKYYLDKARQRPEVPILVARQEHQLDDIHKIDQELGGNGNFLAVSKTHGSENYEVKTGIETLEGKQIFCCLLWEDIQAYQTILHVAVNLNDMEKKEALFGAFDECSVPHNYRGDISIDSTFQFSWEAWHNETCARYYGHSGW